MEDEDRRCVKLRGLPWTATKDDIKEFFNDCKIHKGDDGIHLVSNSAGRATGEAFVEVPPDDDIDVFLRKDKKSMGPRYIEVFKVKRSEMEWAIRRPSRSQDNIYRDSRDSDSDADEECQCYVRLRGLPYDCSHDSIIEFFKGMTISNDGGIQLMMDMTGRPSGEAYVKFSSKENAEKALGQDRECIGARYIETFRVSPGELKNMRNNALTRPHGRGYDRHHPYDRGSRYSGGRFGGGSSSSRSSRYISKGFEEDNWYGSGDRHHDRGWGRPPLPFRGYSRGSGGSSISSSEKNCVLMRGVPFKANEYDIRKFFDPLHPTAVDIIYESSGRPSGTAKVLFANGDDVTRAMGKHKDRMEHRYIELFLHNA